MKRCMRIVIDVLWLALLIPLYLACPQLLGETQDGASVYK